MSEPLVTRSENRAGVILSRRLEDDQGRFAGVVTAIVDFEDLQQFYGAVDLGRGGAIHLLRSDGTLLVSNPDTGNAIGRKFPSLVRAAGAPVSAVVSPLDGKRNLIAVAPVRDAPLFLTVTKDEGVALQPWRGEAVRLALRTAVLVLLGAVTLAALLRQLRRVESGERALRESEERYALAMEGANEGHWDWDLLTGRLFLSPKMKMLQGRSADSPTTTLSAWMEQIVIHPDDAARFEGALDDHLAGRTARYECEYRVPPGRRRLVLAAGARPVSA